MEYCYQISANVIYRSRKLGAKVDKTIRHGARHAPTPNESRKNIHPEAPKGLVVLVKTFYWSAGALFVTSTKAKKNRKQEESALRQLHVVRCIIIGYQRHHPALGVTSTAQPRCPVLKILIALLTSNLVGYTLTHITAVRFLRALLWASLGRLCDEEGRTEATAWTSLGP